MYGGIKVKVIGLIGGMSWESSVEYYRIINEEIKNRLGGLHSANCILYSVDFEEIEHYQTKGDWKKAGSVLSDTARSLEKAGADFIIICTNTMHKVIDDIQSKINIPILHIADTTASQIRKKDVHTVGLLGTKYTMEQDFYKSRLGANGIHIIIPGNEDRKLINKVIFDELCLGVIHQNSKDYYKKVIQDLVDRGAEGIVLGCTEIGLLIKEEDFGCPLFNTTYIHAFEAVNKALE